MRKKLLFPAFDGEFKDGKAIRLFTKSKQKSSNKGKKSAASRVTSLHLRGIVGHRGKTIMGVLVDKVKQNNAKKRKTAILI